MDKDYLLDLMVNVRERMIPVDEAVETICALADADTGEKQCNLPDVMARLQTEIDSRHNAIHKEGFEDYKQLDKAMDEYRSLIIARRILFEL